LKELDYFLVPKKSDPTKLTASSTILSSLETKSKVETAMKRKRKEPAWIEDSLIESGDYIIFRHYGYGYALLVGQFDKICDSTGQILKFKSLYSLSYSGIYSGRLFLEDDSKEYDFTCVEASNINFMDKCCRLAEEDEIYELNQALNKKHNIPEPDKLEELLGRDETDEDKFIEFNSVEFDPEKYNLLYINGEEEKFPARIISEGEIKSSRGYDTIIAYLPEGEEDERLITVDSQGYEENEGSGMIVLINKTK
jgi:hypothetical protein